MTYRVIKVFADLQDGKHLYGVGDIYPRPGLEVTKERLFALATCDNATREPLIEAMEGPSDGREKKDDEIVEPPAQKRQTPRRKRGDAND